MLEVLAVDSAIMPSKPERLTRCEAIIGSGLQICWQVGSAFQEILNDKLYEPQYSTFADYCRERWGFGPRQMQRLTVAAEVANDLAPIISTLRPIGRKPDNESQLRPLVSLETEERREAWQRAVETAPNGKITAAHVQRVVEEEFAPRARPAAAPKMAVHYSSDTPEWRTPSGIIERVTRVLGLISLDPCAESHETPNVPAAHLLTREDDGLAHPWFGTVYMNPPYGHEIAAWIEHLCDEYEAGHIEAAIALVPARTDTRWFRRLKEYPRCFIWGRLRFSGMDNAAPFPSMAVYLGHNLKEFVGVFSDIGDIYALA